MMPLFWYETIMNNGWVIMKKILTIAGSDCSGGAGIQADIKTITAHRMYAMSVITALTAQNTTGVSKIMEAEKDFVAAQLDAVFSDIPPDAVKIGMVANADIIKIIAAKLSEYNAKNIVVDPVMAATSGSSLLEKDAVEALKQELLPMADVITPNIFETGILCGIVPRSEEEMEQAAKKIFAEIYKNCDREAAVLIKGGHLADDAADVLRDQTVTYVYNGTKINTANTHGTGCTLSSAIACNMANGFNIYESVKYAKKYINLLLNAGLDLGKGNGPLNHMAAGAWISKEILD